MLYIGTGIVTSVPSDSPDDYAALRDLKNKKVCSITRTVIRSWMLQYEISYICYDQELWIWDSLVYLWMPLWPTGHLSLYQLKQEEFWMKWWKIASEFTALDLLILLVFSNQCHDKLRWLGPHHGGCTIEFKFSGISCVVYNCWI